MVMRPISQLLYSSGYGLTLHFGSIHSRRGVGSISYMIHARWLPWDSDHAILMASAIQQTGMLL